MSVSPVNACSDCQIGEQKVQKTSSIGLLLTLYRFVLDVKYSIKAREFIRLRPTKIRIFTIPFRELRGHNISRDTAQKQDLRPTETTPTSDHPVHAHYPTLLETIYNFTEGNEPTNLHVSGVRKSEHPENTHMITRKMYKLYTDSTRSQDCPWVSGNVRKQLSHCATVTPCIE